MKLPKLKIRTLLILVALCALTFWAVGYFWEEAKRRSPEIDQRLKICQQQVQNAKLMHRGLLKFIGESQDSLDKARLNPPGHDDSRGRTLESEITQAESNAEALLKMMESASREERYYQRISWVPWLPFPLGDLRGVKADQE